MPQNKYGSGNYYHIGIKYFFLKYLTETIQTITHKEAIMQPIATLLGCIIATSTSVWI